MESEIDVLKKIERIWKRQAYLKKVESRKIKMIEQESEPEKLKKRPKYSLVGDPCITEPGFLETLKRKRHVMDHQKIEEIESPAPKKPVSKLDPTIVYIVFDETDNIPDHILPYLAPETQEKIRNKQKVKLSELNFDSIQKSSNDKSVNAKTIEKNSFVQVENVKKSSSIPKLIPALSFLSNRSNIKEDIKPEKIDSKSKSRDFFQNLDIYASQKSESIKTANSHLKEIYPAEIHSDQICDDILDEIDKKHEINTNDANSSELFEKNMEIDDNLKNSEDIFVTREDDRSIDIDVLTKSDDDSSEVIEIDFDKNCKNQTDFKMDEDEKKSYLNFNTKNFDYTIDEDENQTKVDGKDIINMKKANLDINNFTNKFDDAENISVKNTFLSTNNVLNNSNISTIPTSCTSQTRSDVISNLKKNINDTTDEYPKSVHSLDIFLNEKQKNFLVNVQSKINEEIPIVTKSEVEPPISSIKMDIDDENQLDQVIIPKFDSSTQSNSELNLVLSDSSSILTSNITSKTNSIFSLPTFSSSTSNPFFNFTQTSFPQINPLVNNTPSSVVFCGGLETSNIFKTFSAPIVEPSNLFNASVNKYLPFSQKNSNNIVQSQTLNSFNINPSEYSKSNSSFTLGSFQNDKSISVQTTSQTSPFGIPNSNIIPIISSKNNIFQTATGSFNGNNQQNGISSALSFPTSFSSQNQLNFGSNFTSNSFSFPSLTKTENTNTIASFLPIFQNVNSTVSSFKSFAAPINFQQSQLSSISNTSVPSFNMQSFQTSQPNPQALNYNINGSFIPNTSNLSGFSANIPFNSGVSSNKGMFSTPVTSTVFPFNQTSSFAFGNSSTANLDNSKNVEFHNIFEKMGKPQNNGLISPLSNTSLNISAMSQNNNNIFSNFSNNSTFQSTASPTQQFNFNNPATSNGNPFNFSLQTSQNSIQNQSGSNDPSLSNRRFIRARRTYRR